MKAFLKIIVIALIIYFISNELFKNFSNNEAEKEIFKQQIEEYNWINEKLKDDCRSFEGLPEKVLYWNELEGFNLDCDYYDDIPTNSKSALFRINILQSIIENNCNNYKNLSDELLEYNEIYGFNIECF